VVALVVALAFEQPCGKDTVGCRLDVLRNKTGPEQERGDFAATTIWNVRPDHTALTTRRGLSSSAFQTLSFTSAIPRVRGHLKRAAVARVREILQEPDSLLQLFCLNYDFGDAWFAFTSATTAPTRILDLAVNEDRFPYGSSRSAWTTRWSRRLPSSTGKAQGGGGSCDGAVCRRRRERWTIHVDQGSAVFPFLKKYNDSKVSMAGS
jgi:hypothetical protein